jgi:hypothetical protein
MPTKEKETTEASLIPSSELAQRHQLRGTFKKRYRLQKFRSGYPKTTLLAILTGAIKVNLRIQ